MFEIGKSSDLACYLVNATGWQIVALYHVVNGSSTVVVTIDNSTGTVTSYKADNYNVAYSVGMEVTITVKINNVSCNSKGDYVCSVIAGPYEKPVASVTSTAFVSVSGMYN